MTENARERIKQLAESAKPWVDEGWEDTADEFYGEYHSLDSGGIFAPKEQAALMAACTPEAVLALLADLDRLTEAIEIIAAGNPVKRYGKTYIRPGIDFAADTLAAGSSGGEKP